MIKTFENILRIISPDNKHIDEENEQLIILEDKTGEFYYEENLSLKARKLLGYKFSYYVVNFSEFAKVENLICELSDPNKGITIKLEMSFDISCIRGKATKVIDFLRNADDPHKVLKRSFSNWIRKFAKDHPNFTDDFLKLDQEIRLFIENQAKRKGFTINITHFAPSYDNDLNQSLEHIAFVHTTTCEVLDYQIEVKSKIVVNLINRRVFSWRNIEDPEKWIKEKTDTIIQNELINKSFIQIIKDFDRLLKNNILKKLDAEVKNIGYSIQHIVSVPSQEIADFIDGFTIELDNNLQYATSKTEIKVPLSVTIEGKGTKIEGINPKYIKPKKSIIDAVQKETIQIITSIIRNTPPENYYTQFDALSLEIKERLRDTYSFNFKMDADDLRISISSLRTGLEERYDKLFAEYGSIIIESQSQHTFYEIRFGIAAVSNWFIFHKNHIKYDNQTALEYKEIGDYIKNNIELEVMRIESAYINNIDSRKLDEGIIELFKNSQYIITEEFGLQLKSPRLKRVKKSDDSSNHFDIQLLIEKKNDIKREMTQALLAEDDELIDELSEKLEKINRHTQDVTKNNATSLFGTDPQVKKITDNDNESS